MKQKALLSNRKSFEKLKTHLRERHTQQLSTPEIRIRRVSHQNTFKAACGCGESSPKTENWTEMGRWAQTHRDETGHQLSKRGMK